MCLLFATTFDVAPARAQQPAPEAPAEAPAATVEPLEVVVTGTRTPEDAQRAVVKTSRVTRDEAERRGATNVAEALTGELGVQVNPGAYGAIGSPAAIQIQGLDRDRVLVLEDGERLIGGVDGALDLAQLPLTDVTAIELVTGPTSSLYGTSAIGGVVNILTGPPRHSGASGRVRAEARYPWGALGQGSAFYREGDDWVGLDASTQYSESVRLREDLPDVLPQRRQFLVGLRAGTVSGPVGLTLKSRFIRDQTDGRSEEDVPGLGLYVSELPGVTDRLTLHVAETLRLGAGSTLRLTSGRQWVFGRTAKDRVDSPLDEVRRRNGRLQSFEAVATLADGDRTWVVGSRAEVEQFDQTLDRTEAIGGALVETHVVEVPPSTLGSIALYTQLSWQLHEVITVLAGARGEAHLRRGGVVAPRLALVVFPVSWLTLRASGGRGFRAPAARELGFAFDHSALGYRVIGNPDLQPETSWGLNGDVTVGQPRFRVRGGVYANWIGNLISIDYLDAGASGVEDYSYRNVSEARTFGGQVDVRTAPARWLSAEWGYAFTWTRDDAEQRPLVGRPPHTAYAAAQITLPAGFEIYVRHRVVTDAFVDEGVRAPGFGMLDARVAKSLWPTAKAYVGVLNLGDARKDPGRVGDQRPLAGRVLYLGLTTDIPGDTEPCADC